jgi:hypothetical protein
MHGITYPGPTVCPWNVCPVFAYAKLSGKYWSVQQCLQHFTSNGGIGIQDGFSGIHGGPVY